MCCADLLARDRPRNVGKASAARRWGRGGGLQANHALVLPTAEQKGNNYDVQQINKITETQTLMVAD